MNDNKDMTVVDAEVVAITPMTLISKAQDSNASVEQMAQLFELQLRWEANEAKKAYHTAIAAFKAESIKIIKDKHVGYGQTNYSHASIGNVVQTIIPALSRHGLSHSWDITQDGGSIKVTCKLSHELGHSTEVSMVASKDDSGKKNQIQQVASTVTYLQRYTILSITGLATQDQDDDGCGSGAPEVEVITESQVADLIALMDEVNADEAGFCAFYQVKDIAFLPAAKFNHAVKSLEAKRRK